eukprot:TRINITY_DN15099_c0_g2_i2.p1 TRINITY_DN15099_c0_g2~~TRINITY_DN15099_c0_g2_i2.p1  ORF type:complete len:198 (-),score=27.59 TRINITY_DN15099_c0_g2_i2:40-633(-)
MGCADCGDADTPEVDKDNPQKLNPPPQAGKYLITVSAPQTQTSATSHNFTAAQRAAEAESRGRKERKMVNCSAQTEGVNGEKEVGGRGRGVEEVVGNEEYLPEYVARDSAFKEVLKSIPDVESTLPKCLKEVTEVVQNTNGVKVNTMAQDKGDNKAQMKGNTIVHENTNTTPNNDAANLKIEPVSYTHLTLPTNREV